MAIRRGSAEPHRHKRAAAAAAAHVIPLKTNRAAVAAAAHVTSRASATASRQLSCASPNARRSRYGSTCRRGSSLVGTPAHVSPTTKKPGQQEARGGQAGKPRQVLAAEQVAPHAPGPACQRQAAPAAVLAAGRWDHQPAPAHHRPAARAVLHAAAGLAALPRHRPQRQLPQRCCAASIGRCQLLASVVEAAVEGLPAWSQCAAAG